MTHVLRMLENPAPEGDYVPYLHNRKKDNGERAVGYYPRIVDADLVARARAALKARKGTGASPTSRSTYNNIFAGLMRCGKCGGRVAMRRGPLITNGNVKHPGYLGCEVAWQGRGCEGIGMFRYLDFETAAIEYVLPLAMDEQFFRQPQLAVQMSAQFAEAEKTLKDLLQRRENVMGHMERVSDPTPFLARYEELAGQVTDAERHKRQVEAELAKARGTVSNAEQIAAAQEMKSAILADDPETRLAARLKVQQAMKASVKTIVLRNSNKERDAKGRLTKDGKSILVTMQHDIHFLWFDGRGNLVKEDGFFDEFEARDRSFDVLSDPAELAGVTKMARRKSKAR